MKEKNISTLLKAIDPSKASAEGQGFYELHGGLSLRSQSNSVFPNIGCITNTLCTNSPQFCTTNTPSACGNPANCAVC